MQAERIDSIARLEELLSAQDLPLVLLKHSTRCPVSSFAHREYESFLGDVDAGRARAAIIYVVEDRAISNELASRLGVRHESPQAFVLHAGQLLWHDSHERVTVSALRDALEQAEG